MTEFEFDGDRYRAVDPYPPLPRPGDIDPTAPFAALVLLVDEACREGYAR